MERRAFLRGAGIVTVLVAGGSVWRAWDRESSWLFRRIRNLQNSSCSIHLH